MAIHLSRDLENLQRRVLSLASAVEQTVDKAMRACGVTPKPQPKNT
jgi:hypothetical protein